MKIMIADDSAVMRSIIDNIIKSLGYETIHASNGQQVLDLLEKNGEEVGLILLDWNMPVLNGYEALEYMQKNKHYRNIPVFMISTESEETKIGQALAGGAKGYLSKPFTSEELSAFIQKTLKKIEPV